MTVRSSGGFDWSAFPHDRSDGSGVPGRHAADSVILLAPDVGTTMPLWDAAGELQDDPDWLHDHLGLSYNLLRELARWNAAWTVADDEAHRQRGLLLRDRLRAEIRPRFTVVYGS